MNLKYDVEADWELLTTCNFRCDYCFVPLSALGAKLTSYGTNAQWAAAFDATGKTWLLHITGGEPSLYPQFVDLCARLSRNHYLSINSNLSHFCIDTFGDVIDPERIHFINAAVHYTERPKSRLETFIRRVQRLRERRFHVLVSSVMTPAMVRNFPEISAYFESFGVALFPKVMRERFEGKIYPGAYTAEEKALIREYLAKAQRSYAAVMSAMGETPTINMLADDALLERPRIYRGKLCGSGHNFVRIEPDGSVVRCGSGVQLGNILQHNVGLFDGPKPCDTFYCPYFCEKYTSAPFVPAQEPRRDLGDFFRTLKAWRDSQQRRKHLHRVD